MGSSVQTDHMPSGTRPKPDMAALQAPTDTSRQAVNGNSSYIHDPIYLPFSSITMPGFIARPLNRLDAFGRKMRENALEKTPAMLVNNSSNVVATLEVLADAAMFKSSNNDFVSPQNRGKPLHYIIDPPRNIWRAITSDVQFDVKSKELLSPKFYKDSVLRFFDMEASTRRDLERSGRLSNRWQSRAVFSSVVCMSIAAVTPDEKDNPEETQRMTHLWRNAPLTYVGTRLGQAVYLPGFSGQKTQFAGLGKTMSGTFSMLSSARNISRNKHYFMNKAHAAGGFITFIGGLQLLLGLDNEQSWRNYGAISWGRVFTLPASIKKRFDKQDERAFWYLGGASLFQGCNTVAYLIGGAEKDANGELVDKFSVRRAAVLKEAVPPPPSQPGGDTTQGPPQARASVSEKPGASVHRIAHAPDRLGEKPDKPIKISA